MLFLRAVRTVDDESLGTVHDHQLAVFKHRHHIRYAEHGGNFERPRQNGGMGRFAAGLGDDADDVVLVDPRRHGGGQLFGDQYGAFGRVADLDFVDAEQQAEHTGFDVAHIGRPLTGYFVVGGGEHIDEHIAHRFQCRFRTAAADNQLFDLALQIGIVDHRNVAEHDLRFFFTRRFFERAGLFFRV